MRVRRQLSSAEPFYMFSETVVYIAGRDESGGGKALVNRIGL